MCDPDDSTYCKGATDCANGVGNQELFDQLFENDTVRRRRSADENDHDYQKAAVEAIFISLFKFYLGYNCLDQDTRKREDRRRCCRRSKNRQNLSGQFRCNG